MGDARIARRTVCEKIEAREVGVHDVGRVGLENML